MNNLRILLLFFLFSLTTIIQAQTYQIGRADFSFTDPARGGRVVDGEIHYPANTAGTNVAIASGQFPLIVFGHGFRVNINQYDGVYSEGLVREGYIIVYPTTEDGFSPNHAEFAADMSFLIDTYLAENTTPSSFFFQTMNTKTAVSGHSMGAGCSYTAALNPNVTCQATMAAAETNAPASAIAAAASVTIPSLVIAAKDECVTPNDDHQIPIYDALASTYKAYMAIFEGSHCDFGEAAFGSQCVAAEGVLFCGPYIPLGDQHTYTLSAIKPWFDYWLKDDCTGWDTYQMYLTTATTHEYVQERTEPTVSAVTGSSVTISFPALPGATSYTVTATNQATMTSVSATASTNSVTVTGLLPNSTYNYVVTTDCGMESPFSIDCTNPNTTCNMTDTFTTMAGCAPTVNLNGGIISGMYNASIQITADGTVATPDNVTLQAGTCIDLGNGFEVQLGAEFLAEIMGCL